MIDLYRIKEDFSVLVKEAEPWTLTQFVMWLDLKLSEYKIKGYMVLDHHTKTKPKWLAEEDNTSDVAPVTFRQSKKTTNDFYSDIQASPSTHRSVSREQHQPMEETDTVRGGVGIIDLSQAENRRNSMQNISRPRHQEISLSKNYQSSSFQEKTSNVNMERDKPRKDEIIEIDTSSPSEKMFVTSNKTSTPIQHVQAESRSVQKPKRPALSMGTAIYTSTSSTTTPTFSTSYISPPARSTVPSFTGRKYALGAPPVPVSMPSNLSNLDEMIAQAVQFNEINTDIPGHSHARPIPSHTDVQQPPAKISEVEKHPVQSSYTNQNPIQTSFTKQDPVQTSLSEQINVFPQTSTTSSAVPIALHANIDNINRDISQSSTHSSTEALEIKIEAEVDSSISDSFFVGSFGEEPESPDVGDGLTSDRDDQLYQPPGQQYPPPRYGKEIELPTFEDPLVRRALEDNKPPSRHTWSKIITRCAYHLLSKGVPRKHDYQMFAESFYRRYPCVGTSRGPNPWTSLAYGISHRVRNVRWRFKKQQQHHLSLTEAYKNMT